MHTKTVLFVNDAQAQIFELHGCTHQCMGANHNTGTFANGAKRLRSGFALNLTRQPHRHNAKRGEPAAEVTKMLLG